MALVSWVLRSACHVLGYYYYPTVAAPSSPPPWPEEHRLTLQVPDSVETKKKTTALQKDADDSCPGSFRMPLHYPRYSESDYEEMEEWKLDLLLHEYGLSFAGCVSEKRDFAMGAFLWPDRY